jgi:hypothetical protein
MIAIPFTPIVVNTGEQARGDGHGGKGEADLERSKGLPADSMAT